jgi:hypothetical protein
VPDATFDHGRLRGGTPVKRLWLMVSAVVAAGALVIGACTSGASGAPAYLIGTHDLVLVDALPENGGIARLPTSGSAAEGVPNRYLFITSADTNELRVLSNLRPPTTTRGFLSAPNPLETLSIPVLDRPELLAADEGRGDDGRRVTGRFVYALRAGGAELSIVDATADDQGLRQVTRTPLPMPGPVTAFASWMGHGLSAVPETTQVYFATWDGAVGSVFTMRVPTTRERVGELATLKPTRVLDVPGESIATLKVLPPLAGRTLDGQPFCASNSACLAIATRRTAGTAGRALLRELDTARMAVLGFPGPVRELSAAPDGVRLYAVLTEERCDPTSCGGVIAVDTRVGSSASGFPVMNDFSGRPMQALKAGTALIRGLSVVSQAGDYPLGIQQFMQVGDGGQGEEQFVSHPQLGVFSTSAAELVVFDAISGVPLDYDGRPPTLGSASLVVPLRLADGGFSFFGEDGGSNAAAQGGLISRVDTEPTDLLRSWSVAADGGSYANLPLSITIADGLLVSQDLVVIYQGVVPGFDSLPTSAADGTLLKFPTGLGFEGRVAPGDRVLFGEQGADGTVATCSESVVLSVEDAGTVRVNAVGCASSVIYSVRAAGAQPVVVSGTVDGYLGRTSKSETLAYTRRFITEPGNALHGRYDGVNRSALTLTVGESMPEIPGATWTLSLTGYLNTYQVGLDSASLGCSTFVPGRLLLGMLPTYVNAQTTGFPWSALTLMPAANGVVELPLAAGRDNSIGLVTYTDRAVCYK